jgi:anti-anti-sigma factor
MTTPVRRATGLGAILKRAPDHQGKTKAEAREMDYDINESGDRISVKITGRLTFKEHGKCRDLIRDLGNVNGSNETIDLTSLEFIDSAGLGLLLRLKEAAEQSSRKLSLRIPNEGQVYKMLTVAEFDKMIPFES